MIKCNKSIKIENSECIASIKNGEQVTIETINAFGKRFSNVSELENILSTKDGSIHHHPLTGPIYVEDAKPGDVLKVHIDNIKLLEMAQILSKTAGIMTIENPNFDFSDRYAVVAEEVTGKFDKSRRIKYFESNINFNAEPCIGIISTTPKEGFIKTGHIGETGGNFDNPFICEGVDIYLPVQVEGAKLYIGDIHARQAYGELSGVALEASAEVTITVSIMQPWIPFESNPIFIMGKEPITKQAAIAIIGIGKSFKNGDEAVRDAFCKTVEVFERLKPTVPKNLIKSLISLIGNSMAGQAYSNTSESTSQILLVEDNIRSLHQTENKDILRELEMCLFKTSLDNVKCEEKVIITIGAVKGRLEKVFHKYLESLNIKIPKVNPRLLTYDIETEKCILRVFLLKWNDININFNKFDLVIYGADKWLETSNKSFIALKHFELTDCRMSILVPKDKIEYPLSYFKNKMIATTYPNVLSNQLGISKENIIHMDGSVEASIALEWADSIFDVVETGETARVNGLEEHTQVVNFGAVLGTARIDKLPMFVNLGLVEECKQKVCIAFDGIDGSGKSTLSKSLVQTGLFSQKQTVLVQPYSGRIGREAFSLWKDKKYKLWAKSIAKNHWNARQIVNTVYDRSIITAISDLIKENYSKEDIIDVVEAWKPFPDILFFCSLSAEIAYERNKSRNEKDEFDTLESLKEYVDYYNGAVKFLKENFEIRIIELDVNRSPLEVIEDVKNIMKMEGLIC